MFKQATKATTA